MIKDVFEFVAAIPDRETVYIIEIAILVISCVFTYLGRVVMSGSGTVLNMTYGKTNYFYATVKHVSTAIGFVGMLALSLFWIVDFICNFFHNSLWYIVFAVIGFVIWILIFFKGSDIEVEKEVKIENDNIEEIDDILDYDEIFSAVCGLLNQRSDIKTVRIYTDGIGFFKTDIRTPINYEPRIKGITETEIRDEIKGILKQWMDNEGTVVKSGADIIFKSKDFNLETIPYNFMRDYAKHLARRFPVRFYALENKWTIEYKRTDYIGGAYHIHNGTIGQSVDKKEINICRSATAYFALESSRNTLS